MDKMTKGNNMISVIDQIMNKKSNTSSSSTILSDNLSTYSS